MSDAMYYKISYVVQGGTHPGAIMNVDHRPVVGEQVRFDGRIFEILEVMELMPPVGNFGFLHATCKFIAEIESQENNN
jgi:hypothetical protein